MKSLFLTLFFLTYSNGLYFLLEDNLTRCFKDEMHQNTTIVFKITIKDAPEVEDFIMSKDSEGFKVEVSYSTGVVTTPVIYKHNEISRIREEKNANYQFCITATPGIFEFMNQMESQKIKVQVEFTNRYQNLEFEKRKQIQQEEQKSKLLEKQTDEMLKSQSMDNLKRRMEKIRNSATEVINQQEFEKYHEIVYSSLHQQLVRSYFFWVCIQYIVVIGSTAFSIISLRKYFVKKAIF